jgi:hypothetical protein
MSCPNPSDPDALATELRRLRAAVQRANEEKAVTRKTRGEDPRARRAMTENGSHVRDALRGVRGARAPAAAVTQTHVAEGPTVIEAVVDSNQSVDTVYD